MIKSYFCTIHEFVNLKFVRKREFKMNEVEPKTSACLLTEQHLITKYCSLVVMQRVEAFLKAE